jgi:hypothetical protein
MLACRLFDLSESMGENVDLLIGLKFPAYVVPHPRKVFWLCTSIARLTIYGITRSAT